MEVEIVSSSILIEKHSDCSEIPKISGDSLSYNQFFEEFMSKNIPVIIKIENLLSPDIKWFSEDKSFNFDQFKKDLSNLEVPVYNCSKQYFNSHEKICMTLEEYSEYWNLEQKKNFLYLKDFHLKQQSQIDFYNVPRFFSSDWLNEYLLDKDKDDYRFVYIGVKGTWTPLHADVFNSYSWSGNVSGRKRWLLIYPKEESKLKDSFGQLPLIIDENILKEKDVRYFDIIQEPNEVLFVPSLWYHVVFNLTDVFSINHNWFNSCNVSIIKESLLKAHEDVKNEIKDCSDMENFDDHCQLMLKSLFGMDFEDFVDILIHIGMKRIKGDNFKLFDTYEVGQNLIKYEIKVIRQILVDMLNAVNNNLNQKIQDYLDDKKSR